MVARCLVIAAALVLAACDAVGGASGSIADVPPERRAALVAVYAPLDGGLPDQRVVVFDLADPSTFEVVSPAGRSAVGPRLSPDRRRVLYGDETDGPVSGVQFVVRDLDAGRSTTLGHVPPGSTVRDPILFGDVEPVVWERGGAGFYFTNPPRPSPPAATSSGSGSPTGTSSGSATGAGGRPSSSG